MNESASPKSVPCFEEVLKHLERIVQDLEEPSTGLSDALLKYEDGIRHLQQCYEFLAQAERRIEIVTATDGQGVPSIQTFSEGELSLEEKAATRSLRRTYQTQQLRP